MGPFSRRRPLSLQPGTPRAGEPETVFIVASTKIRGFTFWPKSMAIASMVLKYCVLYYDDPRLEAVSPSLFAPDEECCCRFTNAGVDGEATLEGTPQLGLLLLPNDVASDDYLASEADLYCLIDAMEAELVDFTVGADAEGRPLRAVRPSHFCFQPHVVALADAMNCHPSGVPYIVEFWNDDGHHLGTAHNAHQLVDWVTSDLPAHSPDMLVEELAARLPDGLLQLAPLLASGHAFFSEAQPATEVVEEEGDVEDSGDGGVEGGAEGEEVGEAKALMAAAVVDLAGPPSAAQRPPNPVAAPNLAQVQALMNELEAVTGKPAPEVPPEVWALAAGPRLPGAPTGQLHPSSVVSMYTGRHICLDRQLLLMALGATGAAAPAPAPGEQ